MNYLKTFLLMTLLMALCLGAGHLLGGRIGMFIALGIAIVVNLGSYWFSARIVLTMHGAKEVSPRQEPHLHRCVQRLAQAASMPVPQVYVIESQAPNAFAAGRDPGHAVVAATRGILDLLPPVELEAVIAHELSHIKNRDMLIGTIAAAMAGAIMLIGSISRWSVVFGGYTGHADERGANPLAFILLAILAPVAAVIVRLSIYKSREYAADGAAAALTNNPRALSRALKKIEAAALDERLETASPGTAHLYIISPFDRECWLRKLFSTHPPVALRVENLEAIERGRVKVGA